MAVVKVLGNCAVQTANRETTSFLVDIGGSSILIDCGPGVVRQIRRLGNNVNDVDLVVITHAHGDHASGYPYLEWSRSAEAYFGIEVAKDFPVLTTAANFRGLQNMRSFMYPGPLPNVEARLLEVGADGSSSVEFDDVRIETKQVKHSVQTFAVSLECEGKKIVYSSDTTFDENMIGFAMDADLLIHEAFSTSRYADMARAAGHSIAADAGKIAAGASVHLLALAHTIEPEWRNPTDMISEAAEYFSGPIILPEDLTEISV